MPTLEGTCRNLYLDSLTGKGGFGFSEGGIKHPVGNGRALIEPLGKQHQLGIEHFPKAGSPPLYMQLFTKSLRPHFLNNSGSFPLYLLLPSSFRSLSFLCVHLCVLCHAMSMDFLTPDIQFSLKSLWCTCDFQGRALVP